MDSSDSLKLDENLARFLAAYDQDLEGGDEHAPTVQVHFPPLSDPALTTERPVTPMRSGGANEGSMSELLPDSGRLALPPPPLAPPPGGGAHRIGRFELRRQLGKGGCGIVFLAYDPRMRREVALKVPRPEMLMNPDAKRRLKLEALAASEFDHPNLVPVYEWGEVGPLCFIATAFCPGQTLAEWLDRQAFPVPVRQAARLVATVADAVQHAHDRGVLHRDLKPNNVLLQEMELAENDEPPAGSVLLRGAYYVPRVLDFGLAKLAERGGPSETATRQILGTPKYMAPEQAQARREDIGPPADVYALGVVLYELLAGRAPYDGASDVEVLRQSVEGKPVPPRHLRPDLPRDLEAICLKAMARTTTERYRTAIDLADDLRRFLDGRPTVARPLAWSGRAVRWLRRNDQIVAIAVLAVIALFVTLLGTWNSYTTRNLRTDHNRVLNDQAARNRTDNQREYARQVRDGYFAWRGGNTKAAGEALEAARQAGERTMDWPEFAHDYLKRLVDAGQLVIVCPAGAVTALGVSPDGSRLASGHADGTLAVWDRGTGTHLGSVKAHEGEVRRVEFALGGSLLVTCGPLPERRTGVLGWAVGKSGAPEQAPSDHRLLAPGAECFAVSPDGKTLFAGGRDGLLLTRSLSEPAPAVARAAEPGQPAVTALAVSRDGTRVITADARGTVSCYTAVLKPEAREYRFGEAVCALVVTEAGLPAVGFADGSVFVAQPVCHPLMFPAGGRVNWLAVASDGNFALSGRPGCVRLGPGCELPTGDSGEVRAGTFSPDGKLLFTAGTDGVIRAWSTTRDARDRGADLSDRITSVGVSRDGAVRVIADRTHTNRYTTAGGATLLEGAKAPLAAVRVLTDGTVRGVSFEGRSAVVADYSGNTGAVRLRVTVPEGRVPVGATLTPDGATLAVLDDAGSVVVWSVAERKSFPGRFDTGVRRAGGPMALSDDGKVLAARDPAGVSVWTVGTPDTRVVIPADDQAVFRFLSAGDRLAVSGRDGVVRVFTTSGREELTLFGHVGRVTGLGVSPDGRTLVSGCSTGEVRFWDLKAGVELFGLRRHSVAVTVIEFAADGKYMVTGGDGQVAVWDAR